MIARLAVAAGQRLLRSGFHAPRQHWARRVWDGDRAEGHAVLGPAYVAERKQIQALLASLAPRLTSPWEAVDVAAGTGRYTRALLEAGAARVTAIDVSPASLAALTNRAADPTRVTTVCADLFAALPPGTVPEAGFDIVLCCDAIHHVGPLPAVLTRLRELAAPGGLLVGDVWTADHFHEFQRARRSRVEHVLASIRFLAAAAVNRLLRRAFLQAARSQLLSAAQVQELLRETLGPQVQLNTSRYWVSFAYRLPPGQDNAGQGSVCLGPLGR
ncbi:class I SAM-dependent methyltransferase [Micromonospora sp. DT201]|uniref:class I SAM-dependent methyltransferase n=1 Tax=Micromonospora sp. DT201 TaxID=3393442 RepID=UPI003CFAD52D